MADLRIRTPFPRKKCLPPAFEEQSFIFTLPTPPPIVRISGFATDVTPITFICMTCVFQVLCNGYGTCECGNCVCNASTVYRGKYCDECPVSILCTCCQYIARSVCPPRSVNLHFAFEQQVTEQLLEHLC